MRLVCQTIQLYPLFIPEDSSNMFVEPSWDVKKQVAMFSILNFTYG